MTSKLKKNKQTGNSLKVKHICILHKMLNIQSLGPGYGFEGLPLRPGLIMSGSIDIKKRGAWSKSVYTSAL